MNRNEISLSTACEIIKVYSELGNERILEMVNEAIEFRIPKRGDLYFSNVSGQLLEAIYDTYDRPRLIKERNTYVNSDLSYKISVGDIYKKPVKIPKGYRFLDFRPVQKNDLFILPVNGLIQNACNPVSGIVRIIVEKE